MRLEEIKARITEIQEDIKKRDTDLTPDEIKAYEIEIDALEVEQRSILDTAEKRNKLLDKIATSESQGAIVSTRSFPGIGQRIAEGDDDADPADPYGSIAYRKAFMGYVTAGREIPVELRANAVTKTSDAGVAVPTTVLNRIVEKLSSAGNILPLVTRTAYKGGLSVPISSVKPTATWVAEGESSDKQKKKVSRIEFTWHKLRCAVAMTLEMDTMALPVFEQTIVANIIEAMTIALENSVINGTGTGQPKGILTETVPEDRIITLLDNDITFDDLANAEAAIPPEYDNKAEWCMSKGTLVKCQTITDGNGQPIFRFMTDTNGKLVPVIFGRKVNTTSFIEKLASDTASGSKVAFLYDFKDYVLNMNKEITLKKYEDNDTDDQVIKAIALADGKCTNTDSLVELVTG